jgi:hypothetical protein
MSGTHGAKGLFHKGNNFLHAMAQLETGELKLTGHMVHILASGGEKIDATLGQLCGLGLRETATIAHHDPILLPAGEEIEQLAIINCGRGQIKAAEAARLITLHVPFKALPRWESRYQ